jgi:mannosyltransferase
MNRLRAWLLPMAILAIVAAGAILRLHLLGRRDLWVDEALSVLLASMPWHDFWNSLWDFQANMTLYYLLLRAWLIFGDSESAVRGLSVLFGIASIPAAYFLSRRLFGHKASLAGAALMAVNAFQIRYSQEARSYGLVMFLAIISTYLFVRLLESPRRPANWAIYVAVCAAGIYSHFFFYLVITAHLLSLEPDLWRKLPVKYLIVSVVSFLILTAPLNYFILFRDHGQLSWVPHLTLGQVSQFTTFFTGDARWPLAVSYAVACALAILPLTWLKIGQADHSSTWPIKLVAVWLLFPILSTAALSFARPVFSDRFMCISAPALTMLAGVGVAKLDRLWPRSVGMSATALAIMLALSLWGMHRYNTSREAKGDQWHQAVKFVSGEQQPGDAFIFYRASALWPFEYYRSQDVDGGAKNNIRLVLFPPEISNPQQVPNEGLLRVSIQKQKKIWLILHHDDLIPGRQAIAQEIKDLLAKGSHIAKQQSFPGVIGRIEVYRYDSD